MARAPDLSPWLDLSEIEATRQWLQVQKRAYPPNGKRQEPFLPVEVLLCYALFQVINPHSYGTANKSSIPGDVQLLAAFLKRPPLSLTAKMLNLEGTRPNCGRLEPELFLRLLQDQKLFSGLYGIVMGSARGVGLDIPDVLVGQGGAGELIGQEELGSYEMSKLQKEAAGIHIPTSDLTRQETEQLIITRARLGQHRFATRVLQTYQNRCGFCGWQPAGLSRMLIASHIKPWRDSSPAERLDPRNGIAACPIHDVAFDTGLLTVNGGFKIHSAAPRVDIAADPGYFREPVLKSTLVLPSGQPGPSEQYLRWHHKNTFRGKIS